MSQLGSYSVTRDEFGTVELRSKFDGELDQIFRIPPNMVEAIYALIGAEIQKEPVG